MFLVGRYCLECERLGYHRPAQQFPVRRAPAAGAYNPLSPVIQKKIALLGAAGVGKTSLVRRFVESLFDETYLTTIGVKVDKKSVRVGEVDLSLMLWDLAGAEEHFTVPSSYVRGASGCLLVADTTRPETFTVALELVRQIDRDLGGAIPCVLAVNKTDLAGSTGIDPPGLDALRPHARSIVPTSAKTGEGVDAAFMRLAEALVG